MARTRTERILSIDEQIAQLTNEKKRLARAQKEDARKTENKRINEYGKYLDKILPDAAKLTLEQFQAFLDKTLLSDYSRKALKMIITEQAVTAPTNVQAESAKQDKGAEAPTSAPIAVQAGSGETGKTGDNKARRAGQSN